MITDLPQKKIDTGKKRSKEVLVGRERLRVRGHWGGCQFKEKGREKWRVEEKKNNQKEKWDMNVKD